MSDVLNKSVLNKSILKITEDNGGYVTRYPKLLEISNKQFEKQMWYASKIRVEDDAMEMRYDLSERQQRVIKTILPIFRKYEMDVSEFWTDVYPKFFVAPECKEGASVINVMERAVHARFYDKINVVYGLDNDEAYLSYVNDPIFSERAKWLGKILRDKDKKLVCLAFGLVEGVSLFSMFALLRSFQANGYNRIESTVKGTKQSAIDELLHSDYLVQSFLYYYNELDITINEDKKYLKKLIKTVKKVIEMEIFIIDKLLGTEDFNGVSVKDYKDFVMKLADNYLLKLGVDGDKIPYKIKHSPLEDWFDIQANAYAEPDFFGKGEGKEYELHWQAHEFKLTPKVMEGIDIPSIFKV